MLHIVSLRGLRVFSSQTISKTTNIRPAVLGYVHLFLQKQCKKQMNSGSGLKNEWPMTDDDAHDEWLHPVGISACVNGCVIFL